MPCWCTFLQQPYFHTWVWKAFHLLVTESTVPKTQQLSYFASWLHRRLTMWHNAGEEWEVQFVECLFLLACPPPALVYSVAWSYWYLESFMAEGFLPFYSRKEYHSDHGRYISGSAHWHPDGFSFRLSQVVTWFSVSTQALKMLYHQWQISESCAGLWPVCLDA